MADGDSMDGRSTRHEGRRREVVEGAVRYILKNGVSDLSMRPMAKALGISHRTLLHHFGSKEELLARVLMEMRSRLLEQLRTQSLVERQDLLTMQDESWAKVSTPDRLQFWRAFFEIYALAVKHPDRHAKFLDGVINAWLPHWIKVAVAQGIPKSRAEPLATLVQDACRGFLLDLITTGDRKRVNKAYKLLRDVIERELEAAGSRG